MKYEPDAVERICDAISSGSPDEAAALARAELPFEPFERTGRSITKAKQVSVFLRDGFVDRYSGRKLVFPGTLRLVSHRLEAEIPFHSHWKTTECHGLYWDLQATVDHVRPVALGGRNEMGNFVSTSMNNNLAKGHRTLRDLGWNDRQPGKLRDWDGLLSWFLEYTSDEPSVLRELRVLDEWRRAAKRALASDHQQELPTTLQRFVGR